MLFRLRSTTSASDFFPDAPPPQAIEIKTMRVLLEFGPPYDWRAVAHPSGGGHYYWNRLTNETTWKYPQPHLRVWPKKEEVRSHPLFQRFSARIDSDAD